MNCRNALEAGNLFFERAEKLRAQFSDYQGDKERLRSIIADLLHRASALSHLYIQLKPQIHKI